MTHISQTDSEKAIPLDNHLHDYHLVLVSSFSAQTINSYIDNHHLRGEVKRFFHPSGLSHLFMTCTRRLADDLKKHPDVISIADHEQIFHTHLPHFKI